MGFRDTLARLGLVGLLVIPLPLSGCSCAPTMERPKDVTGDGIPDTIVKIEAGPDNGTYLFIGQEEGNPIRAKQYKEAGTNIKFFKTDDGKVYFWDGQIYRQSPQD